MNGLYPLDTIDMDEKTRIASKVMSTATLTVATMCARAVVAYEVGLT